MTEVWVLSDASVYAIINAVTSRWVDGLHGTRGRLVDRDELRREIRRIVNEQGHPGPEVSDG